jgi:hypothetical protein
MPEDPIYELLGMSLADFSAATLGRNFAVREGTHGRFRSLFDWARLNDILSHHRLEPPRLRLSFDGRFPDPGSYIEYSQNGQGGRRPRIREEALRDRLEAGATLILDAVDELDENVGDLAACLERVFRSPVKVNAYASWKPVKGFDLHWDEHDVFVLQVFGSKRWAVYGNTKPHPIARSAEKGEAPSTAPLWEGILGDGDVLYMPRGCWHLAVSVDEPSLHVTVGVRRPTGADFLHWLADALRGVDVVGADLPVLPGEGKSHERVSELRNIVVAAMDPRAVDRYWESTQRSARRRSFSSLPWSVDRDHDAALPPGSIVALTLSYPLVRECDEEIVIEGDGRQWRLNRALRPIIDELVAGPTSVDHLQRVLAERVDTAAANRFVAALAYEGLVVVRRPI